MRALGVDLGSKRIGIAVSDRTGTIASPLTMVQRSGSVKVDHRRIAELVAEEQAEIVIVGLPLNIREGTGSPVRAVAFLTSPTTDAS